MSLEAHRSTNDHGLSEVVGQRVDANEKMDLLAKRVEVNGETQEIAEKVDRALCARLGEGYQLAVLEETEEAIWMGILEEGNDTPLLYVAYDRGKGEYHIKQDLDSLPVAPITSDLGTLKYYLSRHREEFGLPPLERPLRGFQKALAPVETFFNQLEEFNHVDHVMVVDTERMEKGQKPRVYFKDRPSRRRFQDTYLTVEFDPNGNWYQLYKTTGVTRVVDGHAQEFSTPEEFFTAASDYFHAHLEEFGIELPEEPEDVPEKRGPDPAVVEALDGPDSVEEMVGELEGSLMSPEYGFQSYFRMSEPRLMDKIAYETYLVKLTPNSRMKRLFAEQTDTLYEAARPIYLGLSPLDGSYSVLDPETLLAYDWASTSIRNVQALLFHLYHFPRRYGFESLDSPIFKAVWKGKLVYGPNGEPPKIGEAARDEEALSDFFESDDFLTFFFQVKEKYEEDHPQEDEVLTIEVEYALMHMHLTLPQLQTRVRTRPDEFLRATLRAVQAARPHVDREESPIDEIQ